MTQKVVVDVSPAEPSWPRTFGNGEAAKAAGAKYMALDDGDGYCCLYSLRMDGLWYDFTCNSEWIGPKCDHIGFPDFESAARWWLDPKPVFDPPAPVPFSSLRAGDLFTFPGTDNVLLVTVGEPGAGIGAWCSFKNRDGNMIAPHSMVVPFYGKITIEVKPG